MTFKNLHLNCIEYTARQIQSQRFHNGDVIEDDWQDYWREAERRIDAMSNLELLMMLEQVDTE